MQCVTTHTEAGGRWWRMGICNRSWEVVALFNIANRRVQLALSYLLAQGVPRKEEDLVCTLVWKPCKRDSEIAECREALGTTSLLSRCSELSLALLQCMFRHCPRSPACLNQVMSSSLQLPTAAEQECSLQPAHLPLHSGVWVSKL